MAKPCRFIPMNDIVVSGHITREIDGQQTPSGTAYTRISIAVNKRWKDKQSGEWREQVSYFDIITWGQLGERCATLQKGEPIMVHGSMEMKNYTDSEGKNRKSFTIVANKVRSMKFIESQEENTSEAPKQEESQDIPF